ncbi:hypothetical protein B0O99DRAFT_622140 [Bisporella sp. PMI_857]|nr:hypothetical protein B0O99DRAFT_622140 [Bisporella sp. PMI_857]
MALRAERAATRQITKFSHSDDAPLPPRKSKVPASLRFPLVVLLSFTLSGLLGSFLGPYGTRSLRKVSRTQERWEEIGVVVGWRVFELAVAWFGDYDYRDLAVLSALSQAPTSYLLGAFYEIDYKELVLSWCLRLASGYIPFWLLRQASTIHQKGKVFLNRDIASDWTIQAFTLLLASSIYGVTLYSAFATFLPVYLVTYFPNITSIEAAHVSSPIVLVQRSSLLGLAAKEFIFTPAIATAPSNAQKAVFDPKTATLSETLWYNIWGYSERTKVVIKRTLVLVVITGGNTFLETYLSLEGTELPGAVVYSAVWVVASALTGTTLGFVSAV